MPDERVTTLELFFDLVFVFTITQLTTFLVRHPTGVGVAQVTIIFGNLWWMFGGYAWLTNAVPPRQTTQQLLILVGMAAFMVVALAIPGAFGADGVPLGVGYLVVTLVHTGLFLKSTDDSVVHAISRLGPFNLVIAALFLAGGFPHGTPRWGLWGAAFVLHWVTPYFSSPSGIGLRPGHFVERHGSILLIAIGESVVAVGIGLQDRSLNAGLTVTAVLGLAVAAALWWLFFAHDDEDAERALATAPPADRAWLALYAFGYTFLAVLTGIVLFAAGVKLAVTAYGRPGSAATVWFLAAGVSVYLVGLVILRGILHTGPRATYLATAVIVLVTAPVGLTVSPEGQLATLAVILIASIVVSDHLGHRRHTST
jgi:low temperature requirement protein LtrA